MPNEPPSSYPDIYLSKTDAALPSWFSNDYKKYKNIQPMHGGGNGVLMSCDDLNLGRKIAIKLLNPGQQNSARERKRLLREARVTAQLAHPNTIPVYEIGKTTDGELYFAMKKVEGENLFQAIVRIAQGDEQTKAYYTIDRLLSVLVQVAHALSYAHSHGVIHRDIKPENIFLGIIGEVYLMDWGVAKVWGMSAQDDSVADPSHLNDNPRVTETGQHPGTPLYMSPEQIRGTPTVDERSDIFSLGVVLYEILTQREPFRGSNVQETFANILHTAPPPPSQVATKRELPAALDAICMKALEKKPRDRFQSAEEMIEEIEQFRERSASS